MAETRVVVTITDNNVLPAATNKNVGSGSAELTVTLPKPDKVQYGGEVNILDDKTLRLLCIQNASKPHVLVAQKLRFDFLVNNAVSNAAQSEREVAGLMHALFQEQRDSVLLQLTSQRGYHLMFLLNILATEVKNKLQDRRMCLERGLLNYRQIFEEPQPFNSKHLDAQFSFSRTDELLIWLLNEYRMRAPLAKGHEVFDVVYFVAHQDSDLRYHVKLSIAFVAMSELSLGTLCGLRNYFSDDVISASLACTNLTAHLRQAVENEQRKPALMLLFCHVLVNGTQIDASNVQLLGLAHLACQQRKMHCNRLEEANPIHARSQMCKNNYINVPNTLADLKQLEQYQQEINIKFKAARDCLVQYAHQSQQLKLCRQLFDENLYSFEELLKQIAGSEAGLLLRSSQNAMQQMTNLMNNL